MTDAILDWIIVRTELDQRDKTDGFDLCSFLIILFQSQMLWK